MITISISTIVIVAVAFVIILAQHFYILSINRENKNLRWRLGCAEANLEPVVPNCDAWRVDYVEHT